MQLVLCACEEVCCAKSTKKGVTIMTTITPTKRCSFAGFILRAVFLNVKMSPFTESQVFLLLFKKLSSIFVEMQYLVHTLDHATFP